MFKPLELQPDEEKRGNYPTFLEKSVIPLHVEDDHYVKKLPESWYSSNGYGDRMLKYLREWRENSDERPFFAYLPFSAPHWPLQAPKEYIDHYRGVYDDGPEALRQKRLANLIKLGMIDASTKAHPVVTDEVEGWEEMTDQQRKLSCRAMDAFSVLSVLFKPMVPIVTGFPNRAYAGMVECLDANVGRVIDYLTEIDELDNTFIMFMSDNGAEGAAYEAYPMIKGPLMEHLGKYYDNS
ncbi:hypothetical protein MMC30_002332 [Trapelia coarctata]|nr:hypothetical protein [Trapelia coarctata]